jgi:predicted ester cyclase
MGRQSDIVPEANKTIARRVSAGIWSGGHVTLIDELVAPDFVCHASDGELTGRGALKQAVPGLRAGIPDWTETMETILAEGDLVAHRWTARGTDREHLPGLPPPAGQPVVLSGQPTHRFVRGQIVETWSAYDVMALLIQLGAMPAPSAAPNDTSTR